MDKRILTVVFTLVLFLTALPAIGQNLIPNPGFEGLTANYWTANPGSGSATWATDQARTPNYSLKITSTSGSTDSWVSANIYNYWSVGAGANVDMEVGAWIKTNGVNTDPATDDEKITLSFTFYNGGVDLLGAPLVLEVDQSVANSFGWVELKNTVALSVAEGIDSVIVEFKFGSGATGTAWMDDILIRATGEGWAGDFFNANLDAPTGWFYWWDGFSSGSASWDTPGGRPVTASATTAEAHSGDFSLQLTENDGDGDEVVFMTDFAAITPGEPLLVSAWMKANLVNADSANANPSFAVGFTITWHKSVDPDSGWNEVSGVDYRFNLPAASFDWTQFATVVYPPDLAIAASVRARYFNFFEGTTFWDDFEMRNIPSMDLSTGNAIPSPSLEAGSPNYWSANPGTGGTATWATDEARTPNYSIKLTSTSGSTDSWNSANIYNYWAVGAGANVDMEVGAWIKTSGVNTSPATPADKITLSFTFYNGGVDLLAGPLVLEVDQSTATSTGWMELKNASALSVAQGIDSVIVEFKFGSGATGTAWLDDIFVRATGDGWAGDFFNANLDAPTGWFYWWNGFSSGSATWSTPGDPPVTASQSDAFASEGTKSLILVEADSDNDEVVFMSDFALLPGSGSVLLSAKMKAVSVNSELANTNPSNAVGFTVTWHRSVDPDSGWNEVSGADFRFKLPSDTFDWTTFAAVFNPPDEAIAFSARARYFNFFEGTTYWDEFSMTAVPSSTSGAVVGVSDEPELISGLPQSAELLKNYPNPFNPSTTIVYGVPKSGSVKLDVFNMLGQRVRTLVDTQHSAGTYEIKWDGTNESGRIVSGGIYFYRLRTGDLSLTKKMLFLK